MSLRRRRPTVGGPSSSSRGLRGGASFSQDGTGCSPANPNDDPASAGGAVCWDSSPSSKGGWYPGKWGSQRMVMQVPEALFDIHTRFRIERITVTPEKRAPAARTPASPFTSTTPNDDESSYYQDANAASSSNRRSVSRRGAFKVPKGSRALVEDKRLQFSGTIHDYGSIGQLFVFRPSTSLHYLAFMLCDICDFSFLIDMMWMPRKKQLLHRLADSLGSKEEDCLVIGDRFTKEKWMWMLTKVGWMGPVLSTIITSLSVPIYLILKSFRHSNIWLLVIGDRFTKEKWMWMLTKVGWMGPVLSTIITSLSVPIYLILKSFLFSVAACVKFVIEATWFVVQFFHLAGPPAPASFSTYSESQGDDEDTSDDEDDD
eukprot:CAMPEP_0167809900 /NCGR_PEP_ID=MMETSP0111_2-20121227/24069_1 /TAXON_ID=91324 /ORGANISM="Lotharella globosa, Strain CCCM811" /LENGTH=372 /DNA_ID=CAMNT_0007708373 /DNA_START=475 /DNA_END=1590 /DNA_ORIENTATION=+